jgi:hypothetical protein
MLHVSRAKLSSVNKNLIGFFLSLRQHYGGSERDTPSPSPLIWPSMYKYPMYELRMNWQKHI